MKNCLFLLLLLLCYLEISAQEAPKVKFEKVSEEELTMKAYPNDTTAEAVILYDDGSSHVRYDLTLGFVLDYERFVRIKVLKPSGVKWGNFYISLYSSDKKKEELQQIKGTTINYENGKIVKSDLKKDAIFRERENKYWEAVRISMPSVKVGSVIDLRYSISSEMTWNLRTWKFQYTIPVKWSQYRVVYPEYFTYNHSSLGYHSLLYSKNGRVGETINYVEKVVDNIVGLSSGLQQQVNRAINYNALTYDYAVKDVPAMHPEPYLTSLDNFTTRLKFELANTDFSKVGGTLKNYTTSWVDIAKQLNDDDSFGLQLRGNNFIEDVVSGLTKGAAGDVAKLNVIYNHVQKAIKWDGAKSAFTDKSLKKCYSDKTGNSADINLLLSVMLNKAGIASYPVVLSTRENGLLSFAHPTISDCNYVIIQATIDGKTILLDATEDNLQPGYLPFRCLNGEGHLIKSDDSQSVMLSNPKSNTNVAVELQIEKGKATGTIKKRLLGLSAFDFRESVKSAGGKQEYFDKLKNNSLDFDYLGYQYDNLDSLSNPALLEYKLALKEGHDANANFIYIDPILVSRQKENPFTSPTRLYPVDYGVGFSEVYSMQLNIPEGYSVEELPKSLSIQLDEKGGTYSYQASQVGDKIVVNQRFTIDKALFLPADYEKLKAFYNALVNKQAEQIVLKNTKVQ